MARAKRKPKWSAMAIGKWVVDSPDCNDLELVGDSLKGHAFVRSL